MQIPDAPLIREAEARGTDYMYDYIYGASDDDDMLEEPYIERDPDYDFEELDNDEE